MNKNMTFSVKIGRDELYRFLLYSVYRNPQGLSALLISVMALVILVLSWNKSTPGIKLLLIFLGIYYIAVKPVTLYLKANLQSRQEVFSKPLTFDISEEEIKISQGEEQVALGFSDINRIISAKKELYVYTGRMYAYVIPKDQTNGLWKDFLALSEKKGCRIR